jgi:hypothetical protein
MFNILINSYDGYIPVSFSPSLGDKMIFRQIVEMRMSEIEEEVVKCPEIDKHDLMVYGLKLLLEEYYPKYGEYRRFSEQEIKENRCKILSEMKKV